MSQEQVVQSTIKDIRMSDIIKLMEEGKTRKEINALYGETDAAMKAKVWSHPKLKNKKSAKIVNITLIDDTEEEANIVTETDAILTVYEPSAENSVAPTEEVDDTNSNESELAQADVKIETTTEAPIADQQPETSATQRGTW